MYLFVDTETGGLTPQHSLLTVSAICVDSNFDIIPRDNGEHGIYLKIKHEEYALTAGALSVNKINIADHDASAIPLQEASSQLCSYIEAMIRKAGKTRLIPAGHNVAFDVNFLRAYLINDRDWDAYFTYPAFDTAAIARFLHATGKHPGGYSLLRLRELYVPHMNGQLHNAETDNLTTIELAKKFVALIRQ
jgi:DNA polymerase III epsilon subunit-like protein